MTFRMSSGLFWLSAFSLIPPTLQVCLYNASTLELAGESGVFPNVPSAVFHAESLLRSVALGLRKGSWEGTLAGLVLCHLPFQVSISLRSGYTRLCGRHLVSESTDVRMHARVRGGWERFAFCVQSGFTGIGFPMGDWNYLGGSFYHPAPL